VVTHYVWEGDQVIAEYERGAPIHGAAANLCFHRQTYASNYRSQRGRSDRRSTSVSDNSCYDAWEREFGGFKDFSCSRGESESQ
jgi:hypothetical protein